MHDQTLGRDNSLYLATCLQISLCNPHCTVYKLICSTCGLTSLLGHSAITEMFHTKYILSTYILIPAFLEIIFLKERNSDQLPVSNISSYSQTPQVNYHILEIVWLYELLIKSLKTLTQGLPCENRSAFRFDVQAGQQSNPILDWRIQISPSGE